MASFIEHRVHYQEKPFMRSRKLPYLRALLGLCALVGGTAQAQSAGHSDLHINVLGLKSSQGQVVANLFQEGSDVFGKPYAKQAQAIVAEHAALNFTHLASGRYALIVFHDVNGNSTLDHNMLHFPAEPLGYSNGFELTLFSGMPSFSKLAFDIGPDNKSLDITVK